MGALPPEEHGKVAGQVESGKGFLWMTLPLARKRAKKVPELILGSGGAARLWLEQHA